MIVIYPRLSGKGGLHATLLVFVVGNLLDVLQYVYYKYGTLSKIKK